MGSGKDQCTHMLDMWGMVHTMADGMKRIKKLFLALVVMAGALAIAPAAEKPGSAVAEAVKDIPFLTEKKPNPKAKFYVYLMSASWCAACNVEMPHVVGEYKEMARKRVEIIYVNGDNTAEAAVAFMKKYKADFPCILISSPETAKLPGFTPNRHFPWAIVVNDKGEVLESARADKVFNDWHRITGIKAGKKKR